MIAAKTGMPRRHAMHDQIKSGVDAVSLTVAFGAFLDHLPALAALFSIIWTGIRVYEWAAAKWWRK